MQAMTTLKHLDWRGWIRGVVSAVISGGAGAAGGVLGAIVADPEHFNLAGRGLRDTLTVAATAFGVSAAVSLMKFLQTTPVPPEVEE
jgi:hypothetical protein